MKKRLIAILLAAIMILGFMPQNVKADNSVTVYLSLTSDGGFLTDIDDEAIALRAVTVPYFDLGLYYGLSDFYFSSESYGNADPNNQWSHISNLQPGTQQTAANKVTLLHLLIYAMEVYQLGVDPTLAGQGQLKQYMELDDRYDSTKSFTAIGGDTMIKIYGTPGSIYFENYWNMDDLGAAPDNWMYFKNYEYPLASPGWGATADQILLSDGDIITMGHFAIYGMYNYGANVFSFAKPANNTITRKVTVSEGSQVALTFYHTYADMMGTYATTQTAFNFAIPVYRFAEDLTTTGGYSYSSDWTYIGDTSSSGTITINTTGWTPGTYMIAMPGITHDIYYMDEYYYGYVCAPGGIMIEVTQQQ